MAQKNAKKKTTASHKKEPQKTEKTKRPVRREVGALVILILGVIAVFGYFPSDGWFINFFCGILKGLVGWGFYILPVAMIYTAIILAFHRGRPVRARVICTMLIPVILGALYQSFLKGTAIIKIDWSMFKHLWVTGKALTSGGAVAGAIGVVITYLLSKVCSIIVFICGIIALVFVSAKISISSIIEKIKSREKVDYEYVPATVDNEKTVVSAPVIKRERNTAKTVTRSAIDIPIDDPRGPEKEIDAEEKVRASFFNKKAGVKTPDQFYEEKKHKAAEEPAAEEPIIEVSEIKTEEIEPEVIPDVEEPKVIPITSRTKKPASKKPDPIDFEAEIIKEETPDYIFPPLDLLAKPVASTGGGREESLINKERLEATLHSFGVNSDICSITRGPSVTRYEMELEPGVKLNKITSLSDDIALALGASGVRIAAIPNKISTVGIEVPNKLISKVYLREIIDSPEFKNAESRLTFALGKDIGGSAIIGNIAKLPHLLVAGTTGSGKSVCLNSLILSIIYKAKPDEVKFIMIDPKMVEFRIYNGIPHLLVPVVTEAKKASGALQWAVTEMMKRYRLFSETGARDLASFNKLCERDETLTKLPQIVVVIDELADLMLVAAKEVEESICRVAQMGRAAGVHLVIATQSPRADVITGLMKANISSRIALKVASALESRIILDAGGNADKLVGNGDMLFAAPVGTGKPTRIQGTWVSDEEREKIIDFLKKSGEAKYSDEVMHEIEKASADKNAPAASTEEAAAEAGNDFDELLPQAVDIVLDMGQASVSMLQRRLKLGYSRAARIVDQMEEMGVVGPFEGSKPRQLLITKTQWQEMQYVQGTAPVDLPVEEDYDEHTMTSADDLFRD